MDTVGLMGGLSEAGAEADRVREAFETIRAQVDVLESTCLAAPTHVAVRSEVGEDWITIRVSFAADRPKAIDGNPSTFGLRADDQG